MIVIITLVMVTSMAINLNRSVLIIMVLGVIIILMVIGMVVNFNNSVWSNFIIVEIIVFCGRWRGGPAPRPAAGPTSGLSCPEEKKTKFL